MTWEPPTPTAVIASADAAERLGLARGQGARLAKSGLLGHLSQTPSGALLAEEEVIAALAQRPLLGQRDIPPSLILRAGPPAREGNRWFGFHTSMDLAQLHESALRWWPVRDATTLASRGTRVVIAVAGFPAWVGQLTQASPHAGRYALSAVPLDDPASRKLLTARLNLPRGPLVDRVGID